MREILFRGKILDNGEWVYGYYVKQYGANQIYLPNGTDNYGFDIHHVSPETVGQYTGLTDKNGKRIFEGDILQWIDHQTKGRCIQGAVVIWGSRWVVKNIFNGDYENWSWSGNTHEVIGNIHDNPELLEVK